MVNIENLIKYYIECIEMESMEELSVPSFKEEEAFVKFAGEKEWSTEDDSNLSLVLPQVLRRQLALGRNTSSIYYGWPIYVKPQATKDGRPYCWIDPVFTLKVESEEDGTNHKLSLVKEWPQINNRVISRYTASTEERIHLLEILGLLEANSIPATGLNEYWSKFFELFPDLILKEEIKGELLSSLDYSEMEQEGFYNQAILMTASAPRYSRGLLRELRLFLENSNIEKINDTALGALLNASHQEISKETENSQISLLNRSQRKATLNAFTNKLSVITGPPGTGKSQVVLNILVNAFENNKSVLFTSKNNKAVDVVCERILDAVDFPINLRLGSKTQDRDYTTEFLDLLDRVLSGGDKDDIKTKYEITKRKYADIKEKYFNTLGRLESISKNRNRINDLDERHQYFEDIMGKKLIKKLQNLDSFNLGLFKKMKTELERVKAKKDSFIHGLIGVFTKKFLYGKLHDLSIELNGALNNPVKLPDEAINKINTYSSFYKKIEYSGEYLQVFSEIRKLRSKTEKADINALSELIDEQEKEYVEVCQRYLEALGRFRMVNLSAQERQALTNYHSIITQLSGAYPGNRAFAKLKKQQENTFRSISSLLPIWSVTNLSANGNFPFGESIFDIVIIDEASQSDIISALPLLYRAKQAVIIGDPQQLRHITSISKSQDNIFMDKHNLLDDDGLRFSYSAQSLYHCARGAVGSDNVTVLNEHYRSHYSIIEFSNREWYDGNLEIRTNYENLVFPPEGKDFIEWIDVKGKTVSPGSSAVNYIEADHAIEVLDNIMKVFVAKKISIGIVTPFRAQVRYLKEKLAKKYDENFIREHFLISETAHKFQGDERDIVIFSPVISRDANQSAVRFLRKTSNLFNVAITRARSLLWVVGDRKECINAGIPFLKNFVEYIEHKKYKDIDLPHEGFQSPWEKTFFEVLTSEGWNPITQHPAGPYFIDLALKYEGYKLAIEVDSERWHTAMTGERLERDIVKDRNLRRMGWDVLRLWVHDLKYDLSDCVLKVKNRMNKNI